MLKGRDDYIESSFSFPMANLGTHGFEIFKLMMEEMDKYSGILKSAVFKYSKQLQPDIKSPKDNSLGNAIAAKGLAEYWHAMEQNIQRNFFGGTFSLRMTMDSRVAEIGISEMMIPANEELVYWIPRVSTVK